MRTNSTIWRRKAGGYGGLDFGIVDTSSPKGQVSTKSDQLQARLAREIGQLAQRRRQGQLFDESERLAEIERSIEEKEEELGRRRHHYEEVREQLRRERTRILERLLPARFALAGSPQVFPVAVEVRLPERGS